MSTEIERKDLRNRIMIELSTMRRRGTTIPKAADVIMRHFTEFNDHEIAEYVYTREQQIKTELLSSYRKEVEDLYQMIKAYEIAGNDVLIDNMERLANVRKQRVAALEKAFKPLGLLPKADRIYLETRKQVLGE